MEGMNYLISTILGVGVVVCVLVGFIWLYRKNPDKSLGEVLTLIYLRQKVTTLMLALILVNVAEAITASGITPVGEVPVNATARTLIHLCIAAAGITFGILLPSFLRISFTAVPKDRPKMIASTIVILICTILFPYMNVFLISGGLKESYYLWLLMTGQFMEGWYNMSYIMQASFLAFVAHIVLVVADGMFVLLSDKADLKNSALSGIAHTLKTTSDLNKKINDKAQQVEEDDPVKGIRYLLKRYKFRTTAEMNDMVTKVEKVIDTMSDTDQLKLAKGVNRLVETLKTNNEARSSMSDDERMEANKKDRKLIYDFFKGSTINGAGLGITLPAKEGLKNG